MRVVGLYKWAASPQDAVVGSDGSVDWSRAKAGVGEYDAVGLELGRRLADATDGELVGVSTGGAAVASSLARKGALSRGLDRAVVVADQPESDGPAAMAGVLAGLVRQIGDVDVVVGGDASADVGAGVVPALVGAVLGWPVLTAVESVESAGDGLQVVRAVPGGTETLQVSTPVVLAAAADAATPKVPGMKDILAAGKKDCQTVDYLSLGASVPAPTQVAASRAAPPSRRRQIVEGSDAADQAARLVGALDGAGIL